MALNGPAFARVAARVHAFLAGDNRLVPVAGGTAVAFTHDKAENAVEAADGGGLLNESSLTVWTAERLALASRWTYRGWTWQVAEAEYNRAAGSDWPHKITLTGWARGAQEAEADDA